MKYFSWFWILSTVMVFGSSLAEVIRLSKNNPSLQAATQQAEVYTHLYDVAKSKNYPSVDLSYGGTYLNEEPVVFLRGSFPGLPPGTAMQVQSQNFYSGALKLTYPLFTGFAVTAGIEEAKLRMDRAKLEAKDAKRNLYLGIVQAYVAAVSMKHLLVSQQKALEATQKSYDKAKGFFDQGISSPSELYLIQAGLYAIRTQKTETLNHYNIALNRLSMMTKTKIDTVEQLPRTHKFSLERLKQKALQKRPDLMAIRIMVQEQQSKIIQAESANYPTVALFGQLARVGDGPGLNGDGYSNKDRSAVGFQVSYNLFSGFETEKQIEAAKVGRLSTKLMLQSYSDKVSTEVYESYLTYQSLLSQKKEAKAQVKAQKSYQKLIEGQFDNQLADADQLSRAISSLAMARAALIIVEARLYAAYSKALLQVDNETFLSTLK